MAETSSCHSLSIRGGLPDSFAYLRSTYPRTGWHQHNNFGELTRFWLQTHQALRSKGTQLCQAIGEFRSGKQDAAKFQRQFTPQISQFFLHLNGHHQIEDHLYFPKFKTLDQRMVAGFDLLESDHETIHEALVTSAYSAQVLLESIDRGPIASLRAADFHWKNFDILFALLIRHLADEEDLIIPAMLHYGERSVS